MRSTDKRPVGTVGTGRPIWYPLGYASVLQRLEPEKFRRVLGRITSSILVKPFTKTKTHPINGLSGVGQSITCLKASGKFSSKVVQLLTKSLFKNEVISRQHEGKLSSAVSCLYGQEVITLVTRGGKAFQKVGYSDFCKNL